MPDEQAPPPPSQPPPAGWYPDPDDPDSTQRYWDGERWTDSYAPIGTPIVDPQDPPRALGTLQGVAVAGLVAIAVVLALNVYADARYVAVLDDLIAGDPPDPVEVDDAQELVDAAAVAATGALYLLGPAVFLPWFYTAYGNLRRFGLRNLRYAPGWAVGAWFVPIFNLFRPKQIANDLYRATAGGTLHSSGRIDAHPVSPLLHWWWAVYLLTGAVAAIAGFNISEDDPFDAEAARFDTLEDERGYYVGDLIASGVAIAAAILAVLVIRRITADQEAVRAKPSDAVYSRGTPPGEAPT